MTARATRAERTIDALALALLLAGAGLFAYAYSGMAALAGGDITTRPGEFAMSQWERYRVLARAGVGLALAGVAAGVWSYWTRGRRRAGEGARPRADR